jgi:hypothetical protein
MNQLQQVDLEPGACPHELNTHDLAAVSFSPDQTTPGDVFFGLRKLPHVIERSGTPFHASLLHASLLHVTRRRARLSHEHLLHVLESLRHAGDDPFIVLPQKKH